MSKSVKKYVKYHDDGSVWARGTTAGGVAQGHWEWFRKNGSKMRSGYFTNGKQSGKWTTYQKNGKVVKVTDFGEPQKMKRQLGG